ncbi:MAG: hypothetical protein Phog2KO_36700 [Phototrophicaceae bacterium]
MNWYRRLILLILSLLLSACAVNETAREAIILTPDNIPPHITGVDSDLWTSFIELTNSPNCQLPCWWGHNIGETTQVETLIFLEQTEFDRAHGRGQYADISSTLYLTDSVYWLVFTEDTSQGHDNVDIGNIVYNFSFDENEILSHIGVKLRQPSYWLPQELNPFEFHSIILEISSEAIIFVEETPTTTFSRLALEVIYPEPSFRLVYSFDFSDYPNICIESENIREINIDIVSEINISSYRTPIEESNYFEGITTEEFIQFFRENPDSCLDLSQYSQGD